MPTLTPALDTARIKQIEIQITEVWNLTEDFVDQARSFADKAIISAWKAGKLLIEAKSLLGHGNFGLWQIKMGISVGTAFNYMKLASSYEKLEDLPQNKRQAYLAIGILPEKDKIQHEGNIALKPTSHHLSFVNRWSNWLHQVKIGKIKYDPEQTKSDLKPLYEWLKELYAN